MRFGTLKELLLSLPDLGERLATPAVMAELETLALERETLSVREERVWRDTFRKELLETAHQSHFCRYAHQKPRGYAGDFLTHEMVWLARTHGQRLRYAGRSAAGRILNSITMNMHHAVANEERIHFLRHLILSSSGPRMASIGCGSCIELWDPLVLALRRDWNIVLADHDAGALDAARRSVSFRHATVQFVHEPVLRFVLRAEQQMGVRNLVYLFGVLDDFGEAGARRIIECLWPNIAVGGELVLTNAHPANPSRLWMEYATDWYLEYRTASTLLALGDRLPACETRIVGDSVGVYQHLRLRRVGAGAEINRLRQLA